MNDATHSEPSGRGGYGADLAGKRTVIVNAGIGVGPAVVDALADAGARLVTDVEDDARSAFVAADKEPSAYFDACVSALGGIDVFVVSAGPVRNKPVFDMTADEMRDVAETELVQPALLMQEAARRMVAAGQGRIIAFASMSAKTGVHHNVAPYAAAKGGLLAFTRVLAAETASHGVTVNAIATALFEPQAATMTEEKRTRLKTEIPIGRFGRSVEAAHAVLYLASDLGGFVTGECLNLSGGRFMD